MVHTAKITLEIDFWRDFCIVFIYDFQRIVNDETPVLLIH